VKNVLILDIERLNPIVMIGYELIIWQVHAIHYRISW